MRTFEQFSQEIDRIARLYPTSRLVRLACRIEYWRRRWRNKPLHFKWVDDEGAPVGHSIEIVHLMLYDMLEHQALGALTDKVLREGLRANAIQCVSFERLDKWHGLTVIQPRWV